MCIVIDADVFSSIADEGASTHSDFRPLFEWITSGKGKVVYGGSKYKDELFYNKKFRNWLFQLEKKKKTVCIDRESVDITADYLATNISGRDYNDHHIVAIVVVSGCKLVYSLDRGLHNLISVCYQQKLRKSIKRSCPCTGYLTSPPKIYQNNSHRTLLCYKNIANCCK